MRAKLQRDALFAQAEGLRAKLAFGVRVRGRDSRAMLGAKTGRSNAGAGQSDDQNVLAAQLEAACHCFTPNLSDAFRLFCVLQLDRYRNLRVVNAKSAKTSAKIQKRTITLDSLQPKSSK